MKGAPTTQERVHSHKLGKTIAFLVLGFAVGAISYFSWYSILPYVVSDKEKVVLWGREYPAREVMKEYDKLRRELIRADNISGEERTKLIKELDRVHDKIEREYPYPYPQNLADKKLYHGERWKAWLFWLFQLILVSGIGAFFVYLDRKHLRPFFYRTPVIQPSIDYGVPLEFLDWEYIGVDKGFVYTEIFKSPEDYNKLMAVIDDRIVKDFKDDRGRHRKGVVRIYTEEDRKKVELGDIFLDFIELNKDIAEKVDELYKYGSDLGLIDDSEEQKFRAVMALILFHKVLDYFGGVPTGFVGVHLKDFTAKECIGSYLKRNKIPNVVFDEIEKAHKAQPARFLKVFHGYNREKEDLFAYFKKKYCQIPDFEYIMPWEKLIGRYL